MSKICYEAKSFGAAASDVIQQADQFCNTYARQGYTITLRQLFYRFIATDSFPDSRADPMSGTKNTERNYKWLGGLVSDARIAGLIDWSHLEDRGREAHHGDSGWSSPGQMIDAYARHYGISHWDGQPEYVEVWVEKQALEDVISRPCIRWNVKYFACKGYVSQSAMHEAARRFRTISRREGRKITVIHLGDHDPSGIDMTRDIQDRLGMFGANVTVDRIALTMGQIEAMQPPPSPAKITDSRARDYIELYGDDSWELDAIEPAELETLVDDAILSRLDRSMWNAREDQQQEERRELTALSEHYEDVREYMRTERMIDDDTDPDEEL